MIRLAQLYTGGVGAEVVRRMADHPQMELVAVLVHADDKAGKDSGEVVGVAPNGIITTQSMDDVLAAAPDAVIYSGTQWEPEFFAGLLRRGISAYTGLGGYYLPGQPEFDLLDQAGKEGGGSFAAGGNIPGLISDVFPLFVSGYTGKIDHVRCWQRNHVAAYPSAYQITSGLGIGIAPAAQEVQDMVDGSWVWAIRQSANMIADAMGLECTDLVLADKKLAFAAEDVVLEGSGLEVKKGTVAGAQWTFVGYAGDRPFYTLVNEQTAVLGLGAGWRQDHEQAPYTVEIEGDPPLVATLNWGQGAPPGLANSHLNTARAMNIIPRLVAAPGGVVSVLDFPMPVAGDGLTTA